jgi:hypothetical protein
MLSLKTVNARISKEFCQEVYDRLSDANLLRKLLNCDSVRDKMATLGDILAKHEINSETSVKIINDFIPHLIPPGTKGVIRGVAFNKIIKNKIMSFDLPEEYEVEFEKRCCVEPTDEIPDWFIMNKVTNKVIIGMNQVDIWSGGQQMNRGSKYLINSIHNNDHSKLLCVVCNPIVIKKETNKVFKLFDVGFRNNTLCYTNNLESTIREYFGITS